MRTDTKPQTRGVVDLRLEIRRRLVERIHTATLDAIRESEVLGAGLTAHDVVDVVEGYAAATRSVVPRG
jgi:hypothetical protein